MAYKDFRFNPTVWTQIFYIKNGTQITRIRQIIADFLVAY